MHSGHVLHRFGPFELDPQQRRLLKSQERVYLPDRQMDVLVCLVTNAGRMVDKETLTRAAWPDIAVSDDSLIQAIRGLRQTLGRQPDETDYIATRVRKGYEFTAPIDRVGHEASAASVDTLLEPYLAFVDGRAALETLDRDEGARALEAFEKALRLDDRLPEAHIGLANACLLAFESTRVDPAPDLARLTRAEHHAREGCRLNPSSGDAWGTLALVRHRTGDTREARAAARKAVTLDWTDWLHHLRLAAVSWGQERLHAAHCTLSLNAEAALAHWFAATVFVARGFLDCALEELRAGCALQDSRKNGRFAAAGLHWLTGLVLAAEGAVDDAVAELERELAWVDARHVYGREAGANSWYAIGALRLRQCRRDEATAAFQEALTRVTGHPLATIALAGAAGGEGKPHEAARKGLPYIPEGVSRDKGPPYVPPHTDAAIVMAAALALQQKHDAAARVCEEALAHAAPGSVGWLLPVEPILHATAHRDAWASTLATLRARAI